MNTYRIRKDGVKIKFKKNFGMDPIEICFDGKNIMRKYSAAGHREMPELYGLPLLFPASRTKGGRFVSEGVEYRLPINEPAHNNNLHGSMRTATFTVKEKKKGRIVSEFVNKDERYPLPFTMTIVDMIEDGEYRRTVTVKNTGDKALPFTFGIHATFAVPGYVKVPLGNKIAWDEDYIFTEELEGKGYFTEGEKAITEGTDLVKGPFSGEIFSGAYRSEGNMAIIGDFELEVSDNFNWWVLYNGTGKQDFFCAEPVCGDVNGLNREGGCVILPKGGEEKFELVLRRRK